MVALEEDDVMEQPLTTDALGQNGQWRIVHLRKSVCNGVQFVLVNGRQGPAHLDSPQPPNEIADIGNPPRRELSSTGT